jgi:hypothetical protein|tara:strand:+ start:10136 stop:10714 length:579 start_codon:yes stop_codon:yes gene_type:complete
MLKIHQPDTFLDVEDTEHHIYIVNFAKLFEINIQFPLLVDIKKYNCDKKITKDTKALFYHHIIHELCRYILKISQNKGHKIVIYYNSLDLKNLEIFNIFPEEDIKPLLSKIVNSIGKYLPIRIFETQHSFYYFIGSGNGKRLEIIIPLRGIADRCYSDYTFNKALKFSEKHNLTFLNNTYFRQLKTKQLMFS